ncbi:MAG TPA: ABC transporter substrate-binding protein [Vicinamibacteria bacterium]|nr:ABC transporter substrate-binding protein [Vicinamibacteria bacterium]
MRRPLSRLATLSVAAVAWSAAAGAAAAPAAPSPRRIASLNLTADEVLAEILPPDRLVAVTSFADERGMSNVVGRIPRSVARFPKADLERLLALQPDLVVVSEYTDPDFLHQVEASGLRYHRMEGLKSLDGYREAIRALGAAVGEGGRAEALVARYERVRAELARRLGGARRPRVLYWANGMTAGDDSAIGALIESAGGVNVGREVGLAGIAPIGDERAFVADPDVVMVGVWPGVREALQHHPLLSRLRAVREGRVLEMPTELLVALSHHAVEASWRLASLLHPDRVASPRP